MDLDIETAADEEEENPGGFLRVNDDDDDNNGIEDRNDPGPTVGEDDLLMLTVTADGTLEGTLTLDVVSGGSRIELYDSPDRSYPVTLPQSWTLGGLPKTFSVIYYVEGLAISTAVGDVGLELTFNGGAGVCMDRVNLTVYDLDLKEVSFYGVGSRTLHRDTDGTLYSDPHWQDNSSPFSGTAPHVLIDTRMSDALQSQTRIPRDGGHLNGHPLEMEIPSGSSGYPNTGNGLISSKDGRLRPEWGMQQATPMPTDVTVMKFKNANGSPMLVTHPGTGQVASDWSLVGIGPGQYRWDPF